jgi:chromosomal replication initiation ATPase DnaA
MTTQTYQPKEFIYNSTWCFDPAIDENVKGKDFVISLCKFIGGMSIDFIKKVVCHHFGLPTEKLFSKTKKREVVKPRQIAMYFSRMKTKESFATIGIELGGKDHATAMHAFRTISGEKEVNKIFARQLKEIEKLLK